MKIDKLIEILNTVSALKQNTRHSWLANGRQESVAEHCWRLAVFAYFMRDEFPDADIDRVIEMCLFHDMGEAFTGDIPSFEKSEDDEKNELKLLDSWVDSLPTPYCEDLRSVYAEIREQKTEESKLFLALDKLEAAISHNEADIGSWISLEYELNPVYGYEQCRFNDYLKQLQEAVKKKSLAKISDNQVI